MAYAVKADLQNRLSDERLQQLTDFANAGVVVDDRITEALASSAATVDSYARGRCALPLTASQQVKDITLDLAVYRLYANRQVELPEIVKDAYEAAIKFLRDVASGAVSLDTATAAQTSEMDVQTRDHDDDPETFDDNKLTNF